MGYNCQVGDCFVEGEARQPPGLATKITLCQKHWDEFYTLFLKNPAVVDGKRRDIAKLAKKIRREKKKAKRA